MFDRVRRAYKSSKVRISSAWLLSLAAYFLLLFWHLGSSPAGATQIEKVSAANAHLAAILKAPVNAPYRLLQDGIAHIHSSSMLLPRLLSLVIALILLAAFYYSLRGWFGKHIAYLSTVLLAFTPFFILSARSATPDIMYFSPALVLACYLMAKDPKARRWPVVLLTIVAALSLYIPGMLWLLLPMAIYRFGRLKQMLADAGFGKIYILPMAALVIVLLAPLAVGLVNHPADAKALLLIPSTLPGTVAILKEWGWAIMSLFIQAGSHQPLMIERLPMLDVAQIGLIAFGGYIMWSRVRKEFLFIFIWSLLLTFLSGLTGNYSVLATLVVLFSMVVGMGLRYLFIEWRGVFPINPLAKAFAIFLMSLLVVSHVLYGGRYGLVAWPVTVAKASNSVLK